MYSTEKNEVRVSHPSSPVPSSQTVSFATLGCKTNQFESAAMQESLQGAGYQVVAFEDGASLVIVNTCTVTNATDAQSRNLIRRARKLNPLCRVVVTGCYAQIDPGALQALPGVSLVIGNQEKQRLLDFLCSEHGETQVAVADIRQVENVGLMPLTTFSGRSRAFVQIQNGCDAFCSYCIIPYARGASRSVPAGEVLRQLHSLVEAGFKEIVLTGIHVGGYGADLTSPVTLNTLLQRIEQETNIHRLRLGSLEPTEISDELLETFATSSVICPHLHIPLQAGDDRVLQRMKRYYDTAQFAELIEKVRNSLPEAAICLDVITGFPGETDLEFNSGYELIAALPITDLHVFPYSERPGTPAASFPHQIPGNIRRERAEALRRLAAVKHSQFAMTFIGREIEVVVEAGMKSGLLKGYSRNYLDLRFPGTAALTGKCVTVKPYDWQDNHLISMQILGK